MTFDLMTKSILNLRLDPPAKIMLSALKGSGCPLDARRHISCEYCSPAVTGGYDPELNQIVICYNKAQQKSVISGILGHEMLHMWDYCRNNIDFHNPEHIMCAEVPNHSLIIPSLDNWIY